MQIASFTTRFGLPLVAIAAACSANATELQTSFQLDGIAVSVQFADERASQFSDRLTSVLRDGYREYSAIFHGPPRDADGNAYESLRIDVKYAAQAGGEADPKHLDLAVNDKAFLGFYTWELLVLHELFHLWSSESFRYKSGNEQWFNEGVTEYYTIRIASKLGLITREDTIGTFVSFFGYYLSAKGVGEVSLREAGRTRQLKREHYFLVYHGGFTAGFLLDYQIRRQTSGKRCLDDLMRWLYQNYGRGKRYTMDGLIESLKQSTTVDFSQFFADHIAGTEIMNVGQFCNLGDLHFGIFVAQRKLTDDEETLADMLSLSRRHIN